jgi:hypothetical protein
VRRGNRGNLDQSAGRKSEKMYRLTTKDFVTPFTGQYHLDTHGLDFPTQQIHWRTSPNGGDVVSLEVVDDFWDGI